MKKGYSVLTYNILDFYGFNTSILVENTEYDNSVHNYKLDINSSYFYKKDKTTIGVWKIKKLN